MFLLEDTRTAPPPPAPPSTPVVKQHLASQKYHHQLLQQLPKMLANGMDLARPEDYMWLDPSGRPTSPPRLLTPQNKAQSTRQVIELTYLLTDSIQTKLETNDVCSQDERCSVLFFCCAPFLLCKGQAINGVYHLKALLYWLPSKKVAGLAHHAPQSGSLLVV